MIRTSSFSMVFSTITCIMMLITAPAAAQECGDYEVTAVIVGPQCGGFGLTSIVPQALSDEGVVVGYIACLLASDKAFYWSAEAGLQLIPMPDGTTKSQALAISGSKIVGLHTISGDQFGHIAFLYNYQTDEFTSIEPLPGGNWSEAHDINSSGQITGFWGNNQIGPWQAFIWENGKMIDLGPSIGGTNNQAFGINENGAITGWFGQAPTVDSRAFIWDEGKVTELPEIPDGITSDGKAINDQRDVAGRGRFFDPKLEAIVWRAYAFVDGEAFRINALPGFATSIAFDITNAQIIVGGSSEPGLRAFLWEDEVLMDLNDLIPPSANLDIHVARGINQTGQIVAQAHSDPLDATVGVIITRIIGLPGDLNNDCQITTADLLILFSEWGPCNGCPADLDGNGFVGTSDLLILLSNWG